VSRGPGPLQRNILDELRQSPIAPLPWSELRKRFPRETAVRSLHRAVRGLLVRGLVYEHHVVGRRYLSLTLNGDDELLDLCDAAHAQLRAVARARGVPVSTSQRLLEDRGPLRRNRNLSH
jgi:hypothetical protein